MTTKEKIIRVALELFLRKGFYNTSLKDIASEVGISKPAIYHHFRNRDEMVKGVLDHFTEIMDQWVVDYFKDKSDYKERVRLFFKAIPVFKNVEKVLLDKENSELRHSYNEFLLAVSRYNDVFKRRIAHDIVGGIEYRAEEHKEAQKRGIIKEDIDCNTLSLMSNAIVEGLSFIYEVIPDEDMEEKIDDVFELFWSLIERK